MAQEISRWETILARVGSKDRATIYQPNGDYQVSLGNEARNQQGDVLGVSVESVTFPNFAENVPVTHGTLFMSVFGHIAYPGPEPTSFEVTIPPGQYNVQKLVYQLNLEMVRLELYGGDAGANGILWSLRPDDGMSPSTANITMTLTAGGFPIDAGGDSTQPAYVSFPPNSRRLTQLIGVPRVDDGAATFRLTYNEEQAVQTVAFHWRTNLNQPGVVYLNSRRLTAGRESLQGSPGFEVPPSRVPLLASIPLDVPFGLMQHYNPSAGDRRPTTSWFTASQRMDLSTLDFQLTDNHGDVIDLGTGELNVTLRLWIRRKGGGG